MRIAPDWKQYKVIATGDGEKLEKWGDITLLRPDPQVIWHAKTPLARLKGVGGVCERSRTGGGMWKYNRNVPIARPISSASIIAFWGKVSFRIFAITVGCNPVV